MSSARRRPPSRWWVTSSGERASMPSDSENHRGHNMKVHRRKTITALAAAASLAFAIGAAPSQAATPVQSTNVSAGLSASDLSKLPLTNHHLTNREKANLAIVLRAYRD